MFNLIWKNLHFLTYHNLTAVTVWAQHHYLWQEKKINIKWIMNINYKVQVDDLSSFFPSRIIEIWRPLLKAWLKSNLVWNSETKGNQDKTTTGMNINTDIAHSYALANSIIDFQNPIRLKQGLHAWPICERKNKRLWRSKINCILRVFWLKTCVWHW